MSHLLILGNAYAQIIRNGKGEVLSLYPLLPNKMSVERDSNGVLYDVYSRYADENHFWMEKQRITLKGFLKRKGLRTGMEAQSGRLQL